MAAGPVSERNQDATIYVGGLDEKVNESLLWELFVQAGPVVNVHMPKDRVTMMHQGYGFVEFLTEEDADYSIKIMNMIKLYGKPIRVNKASAHQKNLDVGANIFIGNLDPEVDEKLLYDTFSAFGVILTTPKIQRDPDSGNSKCYAFIHYASFEASDFAIDSMNGQFLCNRALSIQYAFKGSSNDRHGSAAERFIAARNPSSQAAIPNQLFADAPNFETNILGHEDMRRIKIGIHPPPGLPKVPPPGPPKIPLLPPAPPGLHHPGFHGEKFGVHQKMPMPPLPFSTLPPRPPKIDTPPPPGTGLQQSGQVPRNIQQISTRNGTLQESYQSELDPLKSKLQSTSDLRYQLPPWMAFRGEMPRLPNGMAPIPPHGVIPRHQIGLATRPPTGVPAPPNRVPPPPNGVPPPPNGIPPPPNGVPPPPPWFRAGSPHFRPPMLPGFRPPLPSGPPPG